MTTLGLEKSRITYKKILPLAVAAVHWGISFFLQPLIFEASPLEHLFTYIVCRVLLFLVLYGFWSFVCLAIMQKDSLSRKVLLYALPVLVLLLCWLFAFHPFTLESDELNLFQRAKQFDDFAYWFNYPTGYYWIIGLMIVPHMMGPTFIKVFLQGLLAGYLVARQRRLTGRSAFLLYLLFCIPFVLNQGISAHRLPTYGLLYLFVMAKLLYDRAEHRALDIRTLLLLCASISILAIWRSEGIYLFPMGILLLCAAYRIPVCAKSAKKLLIYILMAIVVAVPQLKGYFSDSDVALELRTKPLCGYALSIMIRNGLTEQMMGDLKQDIEGYLTMEALYSYDNSHDDNIYASAAVMNLTEDADYETQERFCTAVKKLIIQHPIIYARAQWEAWNYTSDQYVADFSGGAAGVLRGLTALSSRVWPPVLLVFLAFLYALLRRKWLVFWITACGMVNWGMVTLLKPAALAKYYYATYLIGYFLLLMGLCWLFARRRGRHELTRR